MTKHSTQTAYGKMNEEQLRILDDVPGSAVELQAKDKVRAFFLLICWNYFDCLMFTKNSDFRKIYSFCGN